MKTMRSMALVVATLLPAISYAAGIFNTGQQIQTSQPRTIPASQAQQPTFAPAAPVYQPTTPPAASVIQPINADPKVMAQFDRYPNESDEAYIARMKVIYQRSVADMDRVSRTHIEKMKALAPK